MKRSLAVVLIGAVAAVGVTYALTTSSPALDISGVAFNDQRFTIPVQNSDGAELTIVSFNIRDSWGVNRTLEDFQELARLIDGADIVVFQEMGAKHFKTSGSNEDLMDRLRATATVFTYYLGEEWTFVFADRSSPDVDAVPKVSNGQRSAAEIPCVAYRTTRGNLKINIDWTGYYDLGSYRDMGLFRVQCTNGSNKETFTLGSVHLKPECPGRGEEMLKVAEYIETHEAENYIILGDFNWGYYSTCSNKYDGENRISELHDEGTVFQVFHDISYTGKGSSENFRTNLDNRGTAQMYDQFLVCKNYAGKLSDDAKLLEDCGFVSYSTDPYFKSRVDDILNDQLKGVKAFMKTRGYAMSSAETKAALDSTEVEIRSNSLILDEASFKMSDHKPIWMKINLFE